MLTTGVVMPLGAELLNVPQAPSVASNGRQMSFAKSFDEMADDAAKIAEASSAGQMLNGKATSIAKRGDVSAGLMDAPPTVSLDERLKGKEMLTNTTIAKSFLDEKQSALAKSPEKPAKTVPFFGDDNSESQEIRVHGPEPGIADSAGFRPIGALIGPTEDATGEKAVAETKNDSSERPSTTVLQPLSMSDGPRSAIQKNEIVTSAKLVVNKTAKKEVKSKDHFSRTVVDGRNTLGLPEGAPMQIMMAVGTSGPTLPIAKAPEVAKLEGDSRGELATGQVVGVVGSKVANSSPSSANRAVAGKSFLDTSKGEKIVTATKADNSLAPAKKDEAVSSKAMGNVASASRWIEENTTGVGGLVQVQGAHGVFGTPGNIVVDTAAAGKAHPNITSVVMTAEQDGADPGTASVGSGHRTIEATPTALEVGVTNGTHGWLKIRAEMADGGVVNASVSATTSAGQEMLHRELPSLTAYLHEEQIGVSSVVLHTTAAAASREFAGGMENDAGREQMQQRGGQEGESRQDAMGTVFSDSGDRYFEGGLGGTAEVEEIASRAIYAGGSWLSVRA